MKKNILMYVINVINAKTKIEMALDWLERGLISIKEREERVKGGKTIFPV